MVEQNSKSFLWVTSHPRAVKITGMLLEKGGHTVDIVSNKTEAIEKIQSGAFDRVICALYLGDRDATEEILRAAIDQCVERIFLATSVADLIPSLVSDHTRARISKQIDVSTVMPIGQVEILTEA